jgi:hypothetical protein
MASEKIPATASSVNRKPVSAALIATCRRGFKRRQVESTDKNSSSA